MSLISGANFVAPLRSKVQVVGIFALAVLVAVLRLVGSGEPSTEGAYSSSHRRGGVERNDEPMADDEVNAYLAQRAKSRSAQGSTGSVGDIAVEQLLQRDSDSRSEGSGRRLKDSSDDSAEPKKLNELKREYGLE